MSSTALEPAVLPTKDEFGDLFDYYVADDNLPSTEWLTRLRLERPRRNTRCLGETTRLLKRINDVVVSATMLILLSPVLLLVAIAVRLTSRGPVIFSQQRVGLNLRQKKRDRRQRDEEVELPDGIERRGTGINRRRDGGYGKPFTLYKFRSMVADAEERKFAVAHLNERDGPAFKIENDPRITRIGRFLRRTSIDELPQLFNVLSGEMSLVGPRPPLPDEVKRYEWLFRKRLSVKPGITCIWQISGRNQVSFDRWMQMDHDYIENWSLLLDLKILLKTIPAVLLSRGAS